MMMQNLGRAGGGGVNKVHYGVCENVTVGNDQFEGIKICLYLPFKYQKTFNNAMF